MITFKYTEPHNRVTVTLETESEHLHALVQDFKDFLEHLGHHPDNIERITFEERQQGLPQQLELFPEDRS